MCFNYTWLDILDYLPYLSFLHENKKDKSADYVWLQDFGEKMFLLILEEDKYAYLLGHFDNNPQDIWIYGMPGLDLPDETFCSLL